MGAAIAAPVLLLILVGEARCQPDTVWTKFYAETGGTRADFIQTSDGGYAIGSVKWCGDLNRRDLDFYLAKLDSFGTVEWDSLYESVLDSVHRSDNVYKMAQLNDGGYILVGTAVGHGRQFGMVVRTDAEGRRLWQRYGTGEDVTFYDCVVGANDAIIVSSSSALLRFNDNDSGAVIWRREIRDAYHSVITSDGKFLYAGTSPGGFGGFDFYAVKFDLDGEIEWENYYGTEYLDNCGAVTETLDGGACLVGTQRYGFNDSTNAMVIRVDANGEEIWRQIYEDLPRGNHLNSVVETPDGGFAVGGEDEGGNFYLQRIDYFGEVLWSRSFVPEIGHGVCKSLLLMPDGGYVLGGATSTGAWLIRTEPDPVHLPFRLRARPDEHAFGEVALDSVAFWSLPIHNYGRRYVFIDSVSFEGDSSAFSFALEPSTRIVPSDTLFVPICFSPKADTTYSATLTICYGEEQSVEVILSGRGQPLAVEEDSVLYPASIGLSFYPNPFNSQTTISYHLPTSSIVIISIHNLQGRQVEIISNDIQKAGFFSLIWDATRLPSGIYICRLQAKDIVTNFKITLLR